MRSICQLFSLDSDNERGYIRDLTDVKVEDCALISKHVGGIGLSIHV